MVFHPFKKIFPMLIDSMWFFFSDQSLEKLETTYPQRSFRLPSRLFKATLCPRSSNSVLSGRKEAEYSTWNFTRQNEGVAKKKYHKHHERWWLRATDTGFWCFALTHRWFELDLNNKDGSPSGLSKKGGWVNSLVDPGGARSGTSKEWNPKLYRMERPD